MWTFKINTLKKQRLDQFNAITSSPSSLEGKDTTIIISKYFTKTKLAKQLLVNNIDERNNSSHNQIDTIQNFSSPFLNGDRLSLSTIKRQII